MCKWGCGFDSFEKFYRLGKIFIKLRYDKGFICNIFKEFLKLIRKLMI